MNHSPKLVLLILLLNNVAAAQQLSKADAIENLISDLYENRLFNGAIVVGQSGEILFSKGYGSANFEDATQFTPDKPADGGSIAKTFTATAILLLAESGKFNLTDPVQRFIPEYPYPGTTIWNLITHSAGGLPDYDFYFEKVSDTSILTNALILDLIGQNKPPLVYPPTTNFYYDNAGFDLAALLVERASGMEYSQFLDENFFRPLYMDSAFIRPALLNNWKNSRASGYRYHNDTLQLYDIADREAFYGGSNLWFSTQDLYRWGESFTRNTILTDTLMEKVTSPVFIDGKPSAVSLGAWYSGKSDQAFYYWGNVAGFYSWVYWDKDAQFTIAFMTNTAMPFWLRPQLTHALIDIMEGKPPPPIHKPQSDYIDFNHLEQIAGDYEVPDLGKVHISVQDAIVKLKLPQGMEYQMFSVDRETFYVPGLDPFISFSSLQEGKFRILHWQSTALMVFGERVLE